MNIIKIKKNKNVSLLLAAVLISVSNMILAQGSFILWGEPDPPKDLK
ncbi:hypothetical protein SAMN02745134_03088 [Clostridium acidisoli DSM 12555]|uniref:Cyclic lactone autoinducer peptide n=1 Tax=Clostridium acidisoli DSM 12555 TaxID=1121291 RepID=A0A1W1XUJ0_9CLOT|nr:hypothetical protein [Clostridium acidisoli]SMC27201.1 hypothetical protein SAMN02745134_03088 [Clostridium acidisoli DSM 12555]